MCDSSSLITTNNDTSLVNLVKKYLGQNRRVSFVVGDGKDLIDGLSECSVDLVFADTWPGKYHYLNEVLDSLKIGGIYLIDDMFPPKNWPDGHREKAVNLTHHLLSRSDLSGQPGSSFALK